MRLCRSCASAPPTAPMPRAAETPERAATAPAPSLFPLTIRQLVYRVGTQRLIDGIDLTIEQGSRTVIMGPNGAGKSLLLRLLHGLLTPTTGEICWGATPRMDQARRRQALVFQRPVLLRRSVAANLRFALKLRRSTRAERAERLRHILELAGLSRLADRPARVLSQGEQQRVALARALVLEPEVLLLDEPTGSLDPASTEAIEELMLAAHKRGTKIILVTHDMAQARRLADEAVLLERGRVVEQVSALRFFQQPSDVYGGSRVVL